MDVGEKAPSSAKTAPSWPNEDDTGSERPELAYCRFLLLVSEIPAIFEYIDFGWPSDHRQIALDGGYPRRTDIEASRESGAISHNVGFIGSGTRAMVGAASDSPYNRVPWTPRRVKGSPGCSPANWMYSKSAYISGSIVKK
jgi:hypothetical protein